MDSFRDHPSEEAYTTCRNDVPSSDQEQNMRRTPIPSDWQHAKILISRSFRKDWQKPKLYVAKFLLLPVLLMLYCLGFLFEADGLSEEPAMVVGGFELFDGTSWTYPKVIHLAAFDEEAASLVGQKMEENFILEGVENNVKLDWSSNATDTPNTTNRTEFMKDCEATIASTASKEVCVYLDAMDDYTIFFGGEEDASPYQSALAGTQWAVNLALLAVNSTSSTAGEQTLFPVSKIQRVPQKVSKSDFEPTLIILLLPPIMHVLACAVAAQFMVGPITYEKVNHVTESFIFVGVQMRTYLFQWIGYNSMNSLLTAILLTVVSEHWNLMPMSDPSLIGISHFLGLVHMISHFTLLMQFINQEELAQGMPFLTGLVSIGIGAGLLTLGWETSVLTYILSVLFPFLGMIQYYAIYIGYDYAGYDTGIHWGQNIAASGLAGSLSAQVAGIVLCLLLCHLYASESFNDWLSGDSKNRVEQEIPQDDGLPSGVLRDGFEPLPPGSDIVIRVRGVDHIYRPSRFDCDKTKKETDVLKGLDMDICRGEVFGYLGHNGAGKTTSVNILADQVKLQRGNVCYHFRDGDYNLGSSRDAHKFRSKIGVCPQHNTALQEDLSGRETLRLFACLKGGIIQTYEQSISDAVEAEVERRLADVKFTSLGDSEKPVGSYSGGMKRKILIAMSLLGDPEVVFMDEPTAGLDPYNRRSIWDMIIEAKTGRSIILTTHFLDEADILSDRVGIIKNGSLIACGSSLFLKHEFGVGYTLTFDAPTPVPINMLIPQAELVQSVEQPGINYTWRLGHGNEGMFAEALRLLKKEGAYNIHLDLTTLEQVFLATGKEEADDEVGDKHDNKGSITEAADGHGESTDGGEWIARIWEPRCEIKPVTWFAKLFLVQHFMMVNAWKIKETIFVNIGMPLVYLIAGITLSMLFEANPEEETIINDAIGISPWLASEARFFGVPVLEGFNSIQPLIPADPPTNIEDYDNNGQLQYFGGFYETNSTLQYAPELSPFALQVATAVVSNYSVWLNSNISMDGINTSVQQLPYVASSPFRTDLLFIPFCLSFGFAGLAFSVMDVLLLKGDNIIGLFRVSGITEWTTYLGVMLYKFTTTFLPFFMLLVVLGFSLGLVLFGNGGRWLGSILLLLSFAFSSTPMGLIFAKRFIHSEYKSVATWFPGVYFTFAGVPYVAYSSLLQAFPESESAILILGDVLSLIPQFCFQRGVGALLTISDKASDDALTWSEVWTFSNRIWYTILIMCLVGTFEWFYLYHLTTTRVASTSLSDKDDPFGTLTVPIDISEDSTIAAERNRSLADSEGINARDLVKVFKVEEKGKVGSTIKKSVKGISFGIRKNEIEVLLGPNGAGKTVTMSALAGEVTPEHGELALNGVVINNTNRSVDALFRNCDVSYVPQFDALFPKQSVEEHLKFYSCIRGLTWDDAYTQDHVNAIVKLLGLEKHRHKESDELSGGYKRRLSLAVALIGYPKALMLDEVTTGLDPGARRLIWDILKPKQGLQRRFDVPAILLSTHYMEESEVLGDRIGIMIDGKFAATGSLPQLYNQYCTSFFVELSMESTMNDDNTPDHIVDTFESAGIPAIVYEQLPYHVKLQVPFTNGEQSNSTINMDDTIEQLACIFDLLEAQKASLQIKFYSVARMNLEQIFIDLSRRQFEVNEEVQSERQQ